MIGSLGDEVAAVAQLAKHHGIQVYGSVNAVLACHGDGEVTCVGFCDVGKSHAPLVGEVAVASERHVFGLQIVDLTNLVG